MHQNTMKLLAKQSAFVHADLGILYSTHMFNNHKENERGRKRTVLNCKPIAIWMIKWMKWLSCLLHYMVNTCPMSNATMFWSTSNKWGCFSSEKWNGRRESKIVFVRKDGSIALMLFTEVGVNTKTWCLIYIYYVWYLSHFFTPSINIECL